MDRIYENIFDEDEDVESLDNQQEEEFDYIIKLKLVQTKERGENYQSKIEQYFFLLGFEDVKLDFDTEAIYELFYIYVKGKISTKNASILYNKLSNQWKTHIIYTYDKDGPVNVELYNFIDSVSEDGFKSAKILLDYEVKKQIRINNKCLDLRNVDLSPYSIIDFSFLENYHIEQINLTGVDTSNCKYMCFMNNMYLKEIYGLESIDTSNITHMNHMFCNCRRLKEINVSGWNTSKVMDMTKMFRACTSLEKIKGLEHWNVSRVTNMSYMFECCESLVKLDKLENWKVTSLKNTEFMFCECVQLLSLDLSKWTPKLNSMRCMFKFCEQMEKLNVAGLRVDNVTKLDEVFSAMEHIKEIEGLEHWNTENVKSIYKIFFDSSNLKYVNIKNWNMDNCMTYLDAFRNTSISNSFEDEFLEKFLGRY